jgi:NADH-quinone oxidoreductase subunit G
MFSSGYQDVDTSITTRELARMIKQGGVDFDRLPDEEADSPLGPYSGAGTLFGSTGGVMEAAVRTAYHLLTGKELGAVKLEAARGLEGVKEATLEIGGKQLRIAVAHQMGNISAVLEKVRAARKANQEPPYHFIEVMACRGGCVGGGGQPYGCTDEIRKKRQQGLYRDDEGSSLRRAHENPCIQQVYSEFLGNPDGEKSHKLLHTKYEARPLYRK